MFNSPKHNPNKNTVEKKSSVQKWDRLGRALVYALLELPDNILITPKDQVTRVGSRPVRSSTIELTFASVAMALDASVSTGSSMGSEHFPIIIEFGFAATRVGRRAPR